MIIAFACDHGGFPLRDAILGTIEKNGDNVIDFGIKVYKPVDFPDYVVKICEAMLAGKRSGGSSPVAQALGRVLLLTNIMASMRVSATMYILLIRGLSMTK